METKEERKKRLARESYHRSKNNGWARAVIQCAYCEADFLPKTSKSRYCSKPCSQKGHYRENPLAHRSENIKRQYGVTVEEVEAQAELQGNVCAICGNACRTRQTLAIDHNHDTGAVRGLLCNDCNRAIGLLGDDAERIAKAASYVANGGVWHVQ